MSFTYFLVSLFPPTSRQKNWRKPKTPLESLPMKFHCLTRCKKKRLLRLARRKTKHSGAKLQNEAWWIKCSMHERCIFSAKMGLSFHHRTATAFHTCFSYDELRSISHAGSKHQVRQKEDWKQKIIKVVHMIRIFKAFILFTLCGFLHLLRFPHFPPFFFTPLTQTSRVYCAKVLQINCSCH